MSPNKRMILSKIIERTNIEIAEKVGEEVFLRCIERNPLATIADVEILFQDICTVWGVDLETLRAPSRPTDRSFMRKVLWFAAECTFPEISQKKRAELLGRECHTSVVHALKDARFFLKTQDEIFMKYYNPVKHLFHAR